MDLTAHSSNRTFRITLFIINYSYWKSSKPQYQFILSYIIKLKDRDIMNKKHIFFTILTIFLLTQLSSCAVISVTDFILQAKVQGSSDGKVLCKVGEIYASNGRCITSCEQLLREVDCTDVFGDYVDEGVCGYGGNGVWQYFGSKCSACDHGYSGYFKGKCEGLLQEIDVGKPLTDPYWSDKLPGITICNDF